MLILMRSVATGGGEAFFGPANYSLLGQYHTDTRARAMSIHQTSYYVGVILAGWLAGYIADKLGWQYSFIIFGAAGILWGIVMAVRLKDKKEESAGQAGHDASSVIPSPVKEAKPGIFDGFKTVFTTPTALVLTMRTLRSRTAILSERVPARRTPANAAAYVQNIELKPAAA